MGVCWIMSSSIVYNNDCMNIMANMKDKEIDLAICDVNYGIKEDGRKNHTRGYLAKSKDYRDNVKYDDNPPTKCYFIELFRISKNQILWGANHFIENFCKNSSCWIVWDKDNGNTDFADCELAWTSFYTAVRKFKFKWQGMLQENMKNKEILQHPNQKPVALYRWLLQNYAKPNDLIFDSHLGSGSSRIACYELGFDFIGVELDKDYFEAQEKRFLLEKHRIDNKFYLPENDLFRDQKEN
jgi:site-specific DNA-methyltransferase (adenine-specific)